MEKTNEKRIDLHMHSTFSDGVLTPLQILQKAKENNVEILSITDHDCILAYDQEFFEKAKELQIKIVCGVEISTVWKSARIHVLGYDFDLGNENLKQTLFKLKNSRIEYLKNVSVLLEKIGYKVNTSKLLEIESVTKATIADDVVSNKENKALLEKVFGFVPSRGEFIEAVMNKGCPAYVKKNTLSPKEAGEVIKQANGKVVLAHPVCYKHEQGLSLENVLEIINEIQPFAIEANYICVSANGQIIDEVDFWKNIAKTNNLVCTIGSDFHFSNGLNPEIGLVNTALKLSEEEKNSLFESLTKK